jgi:hypothetical protein
MKQVKSFGRSRMLALALRHHKRAFRKTRKVSCPRLYSQPPEKGRSKSKTAVGSTNGSKDSGALRGHLKPRQLGTASHPENNAASPLSVLSVGASPLFMSSNVACTKGFTFAAFCSEHECICV